MQAAVGDAGDGQRSRRAAARSAAAPCRSNGCRRPRWSFARSRKRRAKSCRPWNAAFRALPQPVIGHIRDDAYHLDLRCLEAKDEARFTAQLAELKLP